MFYKIYTLLFSILFLSTASLFAQINFVAGQITDRTDTPMINANICQNNSMNCAYSDNVGAFHLILDDTLAQEIIVEKEGYFAQVIPVNEATVLPLMIQLEQDSTFEYPTLKGRYPSDRRPRRIRQGTWNLFMEGFRHDFSAFEDLVGSDNVALMNETVGVLGMEVQFIGQKRHFWGLNYGIIPNTDTVRNELYKLEFNITQWGLHYGYQLIDSKRFLFAPRAHLKWMRYRLLNFDLEYEIPFERYIIERDLDLRFNQFMGYIGGDFAVKFYPKNRQIQTHYWTLGVHAGYFVKLHNSPMVYTRRSYLTTDRRIDIDPFNIGIRFGFYY